MNTQEVRNIVTERLNSEFRQKLISNLNKIHVMVNDSGAYSRYTNHCIVLNRNNADGQPISQVLTFGGNLIPTQEYVKNNFYLKHLDRICRKIYSATRTFVNQYDLQPYYVLFHVVFQGPEVVVTQLPTLASIQFRDSNGFPVSSQDLLDRECDTYLSGIQAAIAAGFFAE